MRPPVILLLFAFSIACGNDQREQSHEVSVEGTVEDFVFGRVTYKPRVDFVVVEEDGTRTSFSVPPLPADPSRQQVDMNAWLSVTQNGNRVWAAGSYLDDDLVALEAFKNLTRDSRSER
jgi:hypothetical protein